MYASAGIQYINETAKFTTCSNTTSYLIFFFGSLHDSHGVLGKSLVELMRLTLLKHFLFVTSLIA